MEDERILKGGVNNPDFYIRKWFAYNRSGKIPQYVPMYQDKILLQTQNPITSLQEAKDIISDIDYKIRFAKRYPDGDVHKDLIQIGLI